MSGKSVIESQRRAVEEEGYVWVNKFLLNPDEARLWERAQDLTDGPERGRLRRTFIAALEAYVKLSSR